MRILKIRYNQKKGTVTRDQLKWRTVKSQDTRILNKSQIPTQEISYFIIDILIRTASGYFYLGENRYKP